MLIRVRVLYFGQAREAAGKDEEEVCVSDTSSVRDLVERSSKAHQKFESLSRILRVAVNEEVARYGDRLRDGDVVAFLPPVAGG